MPITKTVRTVTTRNAEGELMTTQTVEETVETYDFPAAPVPAPGPFGPGNGPRRREEREAQRAAQALAQKPVTELQVNEAKAALEAAKGQ